MKGIRPDETGGAQDVQPAPRHPMISRRKFVVGSGLTGILAILFHKPILRLFLSAFGTEAVAAAPSEVLTEDDLNTLTAFTYVLIPSSFEARRADAAPVIRGILQRHSVDAEFGAAVAFLDRNSVANHQLTFADLDMERRRRLVDKLLRPYTSRTLFPNPYYYLTEDGRGVRSLWRSVAKPIIRGFYASRLGWLVAGNAGAPGECSNLVDYQFPVGRSES